MTWYIRLAFFMAVLIVYQTNTQNVDQFLSPNSTFLQLNHLFAHFISSSLRGCILANYSADMQTIE